MLLRYWRLLGKNSKRFVLRFFPCWLAIIAGLAAMLQLADGLVPRQSEYRRTLDVVVDYSEPYIILGSIPLAALIAYRMVQRRIRRDQRAGRATYR